MQGEPLARLSNIANTSPSLHSSGEAGSGDESVGAGVDVLWEDKESFV
jgi:hypothetical protein